MCCKSRRCPRPVRAKSWSKVQSGRSTSEVAQRSGAYPPPPGARRICPARNRGRSSGSRNRRYSTQVGDKVMALSGRRRLRAHIAMRRMPGDGGAAGAVRWRGRRGTGNLVMTVLGTMC